MKLVIEIPDHIYEHAKNRSEDSYDEWDAMRAIAKGLPKLHGKWIEWINGYYVCSNCDVTVTKEEAEDFYYCPKCGSDNKEEETDEQT